MNPPTDSLSDVELFGEDAEARKMLVQEQTIVELTVEICRLMGSQGVSRSELARRMNRSKAQISQMLGGGRNLTLRSLSDMLLALGRQLEPLTRAAGEPRGRYIRIPETGDWQDGPTAHWQLDASDGGLTLESEPQQPESPETTAAYLTLAG